MPKPIVIDFNKDQSTFIFNRKQDAKHAMVPKGPSGKATRSFLKDDGFVVLPAPHIAKSAAKKTLEHPAKRKDVLNALLREKPVAGLTGVLNLKQESKAAVNKLHITAEDTSDDDELLEHTSVLIAFKSPQELNTESAVHGIKVFDASKIAATSKSILPAALPKGGDTDSYDTITEVVYLDENKKPVFSEFLIPETQEDLRPDGVYMKFKGLTKDDSSVITVRPKGRFFKWIAIKIKKFIAVVKRALMELKGKTANAIANGLGKIPRIKKKIESRYQILKYHPDKNKYAPIPRGRIQEEIDLNLRTLILLHGTVKGSFDGRGRKKKSKGKGSYKYLYAGSNTSIEGRSNWFEYFTEIQKNHAVEYEQIITLEHETVLHDPKKNVDMFRKLLHLDFMKFNQPVALISASRGSLLAKYMCQPSSNIPFTVDRTAIVSGGYSDYFNEKDGARNFVISLTKLFGLNGPIRFILSLSLDIITKLPGLDVQNKASKRFKNLIAEDTEVTYFIIANNYSGTNVLLNGVERIVADPILGPENDIALALNAQLDHRPGIDHPAFPPSLGNTVHGKGLKSIENRKIVAQFLGTDLIASA